MFPIIATPVLRVMVVGQGPKAASRVEQLQEAGLVVEVRDNIPDEIELRDVRILFVVDMAEEQTEQLVLLAHQQKVWVNVHDQPRYCDFHIPSILRQGDLLVSVSTGGKAPGLAKRIRQYIERILGGGWNERIHQLQQERQEWQQSNVPYAEMVERMDAIIDREKWL